MNEKLKCWELFECNEEECPVFKLKVLVCWLVSGTHCRNQIQGKFLEKMEMCLECEVFKENMDVDSMEATLKVVNRQFTEFRKIVEECDRELKNISMELALGLSEAFEALIEISSGDPLVRIPETSEVELISKLKRIVNVTAENLAEIVDLSHEFAIGLAEHFSVLDRISKGDLTARVSGASRVELLESLKEMTNQMIESISTEITERKLAEEALRESEVKYSTLVKNSLTGIYIDQDAKIILANRRFAEIYGYPMDEIVGMESPKLVHPDDRALVNDIRAKRLRGEEAPLEYDARGLTKDGKTIWVRRRNTRIEYDGRPAVLGNVEDITAAKQAEEALQESQTELRRTHHELEAINSVLLRVTKEHDLNGMGRVLQTTMEAFYPGAETLVFLLKPDRDSFHFPRPERGRIKATCYDLAKKTIKDHRMEQVLLTLLTTDKMRPTCSGRERTDYSKTMETLGARFASWMAIPIEVDGVCHGLVVVGSPSTDVHMEDDLGFVESLIGQISGVVRYQIAKEILEEGFRTLLIGPDEFMGIVGRSECMLHIHRRILSIADSESTVLITGESGTGKELVARVIHQAGKYRDTPFIAADCSSFVPTLIHSELFGHEKGAFTGATGRKLGRLERANGGILFLDEVADLPLETQALLLRFLQDKTFERVGGEHPVQVNVRIIAASNKQLQEEMKANRLREDFYYRLNVIPIHMPPLRERLTDLPILAEHFLRTHCLVEEKEIAGFDTAAMRLMMDYDWPGNVRELQNTVARCVALASNDLIRPEELPEAIRTFQALPTEFSLSSHERKLIRTVMRKCNWNKNQAARVLNISRGTLYSKIKRYNIHP